MSLFTQILTGFFLLHEHLAFLASKSWSNSVQTIQKKWGSNIVIILIKTVWIVFVFDACHSNCECIICWISITEHLNIFLTVWLLQITVHAKLSINRARPTPVLKWQWMFFFRNFLVFYLLLKQKQSIRIVGAFISMPLKIILAPNCRTAGTSVFLLLTSWR